MKYAKTMVFNSTGQCVWRDKKKNAFYVTTLYLLEIKYKIILNYLYNTLEMKTKCLLSKKKKKEKTIFNKIST